MPRAVIVIVLAVVALLAPLPAGLVEQWYSRGLYPPLQRVVTAISSLTEFALLDAAVGVLLVAALAWGLRLTRHARAAGRGPVVRRGLVTLAAMAALLYLWFLATWGLNYRRVPLEQRLAYDARLMTRERALTFARTAVREVNARRSTLDKVPEGVLAPADAELARALAAVQARLGATSTVRVAAPKRSLAGWYFRRAAIDGMTDPFFLEIILNPGLLSFERPFVLAHEWAHLAGYADESEANFVAWLTCISSAPAAGYSGWLAAYEQVVQVLPPEDRRRLQTELAAPVVADLLAARQRVRSANPVVSRAARGAYDTYLKANRVEEGIASYNAVVRLMVGTPFAAEWITSTAQ